jgi:hypothetical protein
MSERAGAEQLRERLARLRGEQNGLLALPPARFREFCWDVAAMRREPVQGLLQRLRREAVGGGLFSVDPRVTELRRAEEMVVDQLDREELVARLRQGRLTGHMCDYWEARRPKEVPRLNGLPIWVAARLVDVVD